MPDSFESPVNTYLRFLSQGKFRLQRSAQTGRFVFFPRIAEPVTGCTDLIWEDVEGKGTVYTFTFFHRRPPEPPYNVALIDLDEGVRMMSRVEGLGPGELKIGQRVKAQIIEEDGSPLLVFVPLANGEAAS